MARKSIPTAVTDAEIFINGSNDLAGIGEVELPNVEFSTVTSEQIGMNAEYEVPLLGHFKKLECKIKMDCVDDSLINFNNGDTLLLEVKGALQVENLATRKTNLRGLDVTIEGKIKKFDGAKIKPGDKLETSFELSVSYYKLLIGGNTIVEIDVFNKISNINGNTNDVIRKILGLI